MTADELRAAMMGIFARAFPRWVWRRELQGVLRENSHDEILAGVVYLRDSKLIEWEAPGDEYCYRLTAKGWREQCYDHTHLHALAGHILDALNGQYPHYVYEGTLIGSLMDLSHLTDKDEYEQMITYLQLAGYVVADDGKVEINNSKRKYKLTPLGVDLHAEKIRDDGVLLL